MSETMAPPSAGSTLDELRTQIRGAVAGPHDPDPSRPAYNAMHASTPDVVVRASGTADVVDAVNHARAHAMPIAIRGGGHSIAGLSSPSTGMLIDLADMRAVHVDPHTNRAVVQGGALWADVDRETQAHGLVAPGGVVSDTGVAGLTLGGGYGWVRRRYGLTVDQLVEAEVVTADGRILTTNDTQHPDLFWALKGGGGNFGVVTSFTFALNPLGPLVAFSATFYPSEEYPSILRGWRDYVEGAPDEVSSLVVALTFPADPHMPPQLHDRAVTIVGAVHCGPDPIEGLEETRPLRELGTVLADLSGPAPFTGVQSGFDGLFPRGGQRSFWKSQYLDALTDDAIDTLSALADDRPAPLAMVEVMQMGGAIANVDPEATAFAQRTAPYLVAVDSNWPDGRDDGRNVAWVRAAWDRLTPYGNGEVYLNFSGRDGAAPDVGADTALGRNLARLGRIKAQYDPDNAFRLNHNIAPAA
jgi:FAD/FMN-containing dehydrogenase